MQSKPKSVVVKYSKSLEPACQMLYCNNWNVHIRLAMGDLTVSAPRLWMAEHPTDVYQDSHGSAAGLRPIWSGAMVGTSRRR